MKKYIFSFSVGLLTCSINLAHAGCVGPVVSGKCLTNTNIPGYGSDSNRNNMYESASGNKYEYNLNNPVDQNRYSIDLDAQRRDQMQGSINTRRKQDQLQGQYGGGLLQDD